MLDFTGGYSQQQLYTDIPTGDIEQVNSYSGPDLSGSLGSTIWNQGAGTSQVETFSPSGGVASETGYYTSYNGGGSDTQNIIDWNAGGSQDQLFNPASGESEEDYNYSGSNDTGTNTSNVIDYTAGNSQQQLFTGLPSGDVENIFSYPALNCSANDDKKMIRAAA